MVNCNRFAQRWLALPVVLCLLSACSANKINVPPLQACDTTDVTYALTIKPILQANCYPCHNKNVYVNSGAGFNMEDFAELQRHATDRTLADVINWRSSVIRNMPDGGNQLPNCEIRKIENWIAKGAPNN